MRRLLVDAGRSCDCDSKTMLHGVVATAVMLDAVNTTIGIRISPPLRGSATEKVGKLTHEMLFNVRS